MDEKQIPQWLKWARRIEALAQAGLHYSKSEFDLDRYRQLKKLAAEIVTVHTALPEKQVQEAFSLADGYATPKVDVRAAVVEAGKLLLVREHVDGGWTLPGGWVDIGERPAEAAERETFEESGYRVRANRLVGVYDANRLGELRFYHAYKLVFLCDLNGGNPATSYETSEVGWFERDALPQPFSGERTKPRHIEDIFTALADPNKPTVFD
ncbi:MAG: NUDIX hydrolase N-terminal domain-containing protein [Anaerolineales bacterium]|nr:NUDIX hydrolase N-terminal domain-containing protein [Anaerolineales bacterium]